MTAQSIPNIGLMIHLSRNYGVQIIAGICRYARIYGPWIYTPIESQAGKEMVWKQSSKVDGMICHWAKGDLIPGLEKGKIPVINISNRVLTFDIPKVVTHDLEVGRMAAEYFINRGFKYFAYCGISGHGYSELRERGFVSAVQKVRFIHQSFHADLVEDDWEIEAGQLSKWSDSVKQPVAVFCCNDTCARKIIDAAWTKKISIPDKLSVLGVDNEPLETELSPVPISSIRLNTERIGFLAAQLLHNRIKGKKVPQTTLVPPLEIITRRSSDLFALPDPFVIQILSHIREHVSKGLTVEDLIKQFRTSRRFLERRFQKVLGRTPYEEIINARLDRAKVLMNENSLSLAEISERCGFSEPRLLSTVFKNKVGMPPSTWRNDMLARSKS